jgi:hypothetical protein
MAAPGVHAHAPEPSIAEKPEAVVKTGFLNSRYKNFFDFYVLSEKKADAKTNVIFSS